MRPINEPDFRKRKELKKSFIRKGKGMDFFTIPTKRKMYKNKKRKFDEMKLKELEQRD